MKAKHHFWSSLAAGGALYWLTGSSAAMAGSMVGGFLIDADHNVLSQLLERSIDGAKVLPVMRNGTAASGGIAP